MSEGYFVEVFEGGPWLAQDLSIAIEFEQRGVWPTEEAAQDAINESLRNEE